MTQANAVINLDINTSGAAASLRSLQAQLNAFQSALNKNNMQQAAAAKEYSQSLSTLVNQSKFFTAETVKMRTAASQLDDTLSKGRGTMSQFLGARFVKNGTAANQVMQLANARAAALQTQFVATGAAAGGFQQAIAIKPMQAFNKEAAVTAERLAIQRAMLTQATTSMVNFGKNTQWAGRQLMVGFTVPLTIFGAVAGKTFMDLEKQMIAFKKVYGDSFTTPAEMEKALKDVKALAKEYTKYGIAVKDTLGLAAEAAAAGAKGADLIAATTQSTRLATLGQMEQAEALKTTIALQNAFKISSADLGKTIDFLNQVENQTVVTLQDLAQAIPRVAPVIKGLGGSVEDMAAMLAAMQEGGVTAAQGANALKSGLASLINPSDKAVASLQKLGINMNTIINANRGDLMGTVQAFGQALATLDDFGKQQALEKVFGKYQYARLGALFNNIIKDGTQASRVMDIAKLSVSQLAASSEKELGRVEQATSVKFTAAMERMKLSIAPIGEMFLKIATPIVNMFSSIFEWLNKLPDGAKNFLAISTAIIGVVVPAGTMFLGLLFNLMGTLIKFGHIIGVTFKGFITGGFSGALKAVSQSLQYMSLAQIDTAIASEQLGKATDVVNAAMLEQVGAAAAAEDAILNLGASYVILAQRMQEASAANAGVFGVAGSAMGRAGKAPITVRYVKRATGGTIPGTGNTDTVPAMLTPGEFVINKTATEKHLPLLHAINDGNVAGYNTGGRVQYFGMRRPQRVVQDIPISQMQSQAAKLGAVEAAVSSPKGQSLYDILYPGGQMNTAAKVQKRHAYWMGLPPETLKAMRVETLGALTALLPTSMNQKFRANGATGAEVKAMIRAGGLSPDEIYSPIAMQLAGFTGADPKRKLDLNAKDALKHLLASIDDDTLYKDANFTSLFRKALTESMAGTAGDKRAFISAATAPKSFKIKGGFDENQSTLDWARSIPVPPGYALDIEMARTKANPEGKHSKTRIYLRHSDGNRIDITPNSELGTVNSYDGIVDYTKLRGRLGSMPGQQYTHVNKGGMILPGGGAQRLGSGGLFLGKIHGFAAQQEAAKRIAESTQRGKAAYNLGRPTKSLGGFSSYVSGMQGLYENVPGLGSIVAKTYKTMESAQLEQFSSHLMRKGLGLVSPEHTLTTLAHPVTGGAIPAVISPFNSAIANSSPTFDLDSGIRQIIGGVMRYDSDGSLDNVHGRVVADQGAAFRGINDLGVARATEPRNIGSQKMTPLEMLDVLVRRNSAGGGKSSFPERLGAMARGTTSAEFSRKWNAILKEARSSMGSAVDSLPGATDAQKQAYAVHIARVLDELESSDSLSLYSHLAGYMPKETKPLTPAAMAKKAAAAAEKARTTGHNAAMRYGIPGFKRGGMVLRELDKLMENFTLEDRNGLPILRNRHGDGTKIAQVIGKFQPFTKGHQSLVMQTLQEAINSNADFLLGTSLAHGTRINNGMSPEQKFALIRASLPGIEPLALTGSLPDHYKRIAALGYRELIGSAGADRAGNKSLRSMPENAGMSFREFISARDDVSGTQSRGYALNNEFGQYRDNLPRNAPLSLARSSFEAYRAYPRTAHLRRFNNGGHVFNSAQSNFVPGTGNTDTVPAMLTPGEFVVNKQATEGNLDLLHRINQSGQRLRLGGEVKYVVANEQWGINPWEVYAPDGSLAGSFKTQEEAQAFHKKASAGWKKDLNRAHAEALKMNKAGGSAAQPRTGMAGRGMGVSMGLGAAGGAMMMAPMIPGIGNNAGLTTAMTGGGMALSMASMLPMLGAAAVPIAALAAVAGTAGVAIYKWREGVDSAARSAAELGANLGMASNASDKMAKILGVQSLNDRRTKVAFSVAPEQQQLADEFTQALQSGEGKAFIDSMRGKSGADQGKLLTDYIKTAVASGMLTKDQATVFAKSVGREMKSAVLAAQGTAAASDQAVGSQAMLGLAKQREAIVAANKRVQSAINATQPDSIDSGTAAMAISAGTQIIQSYNDALAVAEEEQKNGTITFQDYMAVVDATKNATAEWQANMAAANNASNDIGATNQGVDSQLIAAGMSPDQVAALRDITKSVGANDIMAINNTKYTDANGNQAGFDSGSFGDNLLLEAAKNAGMGSAQEWQQKDEKAYNEAARVAADQAQAAFKMAGLNERGTKAVDQDFLANAMMQSVANGADPQTAMNLVKSILADPLGVAATAFMDAGMNVDAFGKALTASNAAIDIPGLSKSALDQYQATSAGLGGPREVEQYRAYIAARGSQGAVGSFAKIGAGMSTIGRQAAQSAFLNTDLAASSEYGMATSNALTSSGAYRSAISQTGAGGSFSDTGVRSIDSALALAKDKGVTERVIRFTIESSGGGTPEDLVKQIDRVRKATAAINSLPSEIVKGLKINIDNPNDIEKFGPMARSLAKDWAMIQNLNPALDKVATMEFITMTNGKHNSPEKVAANVIKLNKAYKNLSSGKETVRRQAQIDIAVAYAGNIQGVSAGKEGEVVSGALKRIHDDFKNFDKLDPIVASQIISLYVDVDVQGAELAAKAVALQQQLSDAARSNNMGLVGSILEQLAAVKSQQKANRGAKRRARAEARTLASTSGTDNGSSSGGGGSKEKTLMQELKKALKDTVAIYAAMQSILKKNTNGFKNFIAGPFAPQFIEFLKSQGDKGLKILKEHGAKFKAAYALFMKQQTQLAVNVKQGMPAQWRNQAQVSMGTQRATAALSKQGLGNSQIEELLGAMPEGTIAGYNQATMKANKISGRKYGKTFDELNKKQKNKVMDKGNFSEEERKLLYIFKFSKAGIQAMQSASYEASAAAIKTQKDALDTTAAFKGMGINPEIAEKLTEMGVSANMSKAKINGLVASLEQLKQAEWNNMSVFDKTADLLDTQQGILDIKRQIAETTEIQPLQDEIDALQEKNNVLDRSIELKNRELEAIDESISKYEEQKEKINESFDIQIKALDEIEAANDRIFRIQQAQLGIANALSRGDVAGAAGAMQQLQQDLASENQKSTRDALELSRTNALKAIDAQINVLKDQRKGIEKEIKTLQDQQRANADAIYGKQTAINAKVKQLNDTYNNQQLKLASLNNELARMEAHWIEINRLAKNDPSTQNVPGVDSGTGTGAGSSTPPTSSTTPPALTGDTKLAYDRLTLSQNALNSGNYAASRNYYNAAQPYVNSAKDAGLRDWFNRINGSLTALGFASGGFVPGLGMTDKIPAMLTPGEFVVRKPVAQRFGAELAALNGNVFPRMNGAASLAAKGAGGNEIEYNYTINVNVAGTDASADDIANTVLGKIQSAQDRNIRSYKF